MAVVEVDGPFKRLFDCQDERPLMAERCLMAVGQRSPEETDPGLNSSVITGRRPFAWDGRKIASVQARR